MAGTAGTSIMGGSNEYFPYFELEFSDSGGVDRDTGLLTAAATGEFDDLFVLVHGWNEDHASARRLFGRMFGLLEDTLETYASDHARRVATAGVLWPAKVLAQDDSFERPMRNDCPPKPVMDIGGPGGPGGTGHRRTVDTSWEEYRDLLGVAFPHDTATVDLIIDRLEAEGAQTSFDAAIQIVESLCRLIVTAERNDPGIDGADLVGLVKQHILENGERGSSSWSFLEGAWKDLLRTLSYWAMKARAGTVGSRGLGPYLSRLGAVRPDLRVHLLGHSMGSRVAACALRTAATDRVRPVKSLMLLQGAFSCLGFADRTQTGLGVPGALCDCLDTVDGPVLTTTSSNDSAVGIWYPLASRAHGPDGDFSGHRALPVNSHNRNGEAPGEQSVPERESAEFLPLWTRGAGALGLQGVNAVQADLGPSGGVYSFSPARPTTLRGDDVIKDHCDILKPEVAWAAVCAADLVPVPALS